MEVAEDKMASLMTRLYYRIKPFLPKSVRWNMRRRWASSVRYANQPVWPIDEAAGKTPDGWPGWPEGKRFALLLTHDVEGLEGLEKVKRLVGLEQEEGFRSSYNFIPEGEYAVPRELRDWLTNNGFEVGVHDLKHDGRLYDSKSAFVENARKINGYLKDWDSVGFRSGFMLRRLKWLHELDLSYDSSTFDTDPFEPQPNGCGTIFPFMVSDAVTGRRYVELPYTLPQDSTLFLLLGESSPEIWLRKLDWIVDRGGMVLVNIHPDYINFGDDSDSSAYHYPVDSIRELLDYIQRRYHGQFWNPLPKELAQWFKQTTPSVASIQPAEAQNFTNKQSQ